MIAWIVLLLASVFEIAWAVGLPLTRGFTRPLPTVLVLAAMLLSFVLLARASRTIPISVAYPVWVGIGVAGTYVVSTLVLAQSPARAVHALFIAMILGGVIGLKLTTSAGAGRVVPGADAVPPTPTRAG